MASEMMLCKRCLESCLEVLADVGASHISACKDCFSATISCIESFIIMDVPYIYWAVSVEYYIFIHLSRYDDLSKSLHTCTTGA